MRRPSLELAGPTIDCALVCEAITDFLENAMAAAERDLFEGHLAHCPSCRARLQDMRTTISLLGRLRGADLPEAITRSPEEARPAAPTNG
jgi:predicted anti-sigma-YlaC factor YlaD